MDEKLNRESGAASVRREARRTRANSPPGGREERLANHEGCGCRHPGQNVAVGFDLVRLTCRPGTNIESVGYRSRLPVDDELHCARRPTIHARLSTR